jgi:ketosteroid isomerase-like protein
MRTSFNFELESKPMESPRSEIHDSQIQEHLPHLEELNRNYLRAAEQSDVAWFEHHLADDYVCSNPDGSITDRAAFLSRIAQPRSHTDLQAVDTRIRFVGELALIHAGFRFRKPDRQIGTGRYTDTYALRQGRWLCVSAHFNRF